MKNTIAEYTESEFIDFIIEILRANEVEPDEILDPLLFHFNKITEHPDGTDLIYYSPEEKCTPEAITKIIKEWRAQNGKPGFKSP